MEHLTRLTLDAKTKPVRVELRTRFSTIPQSAKLTQAINHAKDSGDLHTLRAIANDPEGYLQTRLRVLRIDRRKGNRCTASIAQTVTNQNRGICTGHEPTQGKPRLRTLPTIAARPFHCRSRLGKAKTDLDLREPRVRRELNG